MVGKDSCNLLPTPIVENKYERYQADPDCYTYRQRSNQNRTPNLSNDIPSDQKALRVRLSELQSEHRDLDDVIERITDTQPFELLPDIIA